jgi:hypothetical protein
MGLRDISAAISISANSLIRFSSMRVPFEYRLSIFKIDGRLIYETDYRGENGGLSNGRAIPSSCEESSP